MPRSHPGRHLQDVEPQAAGDFLQGFKIDSGTCHAFSLCMRVLLEARAPSTVHLAQELLHLFGGGQGGDHAQSQRGQRAHCIGVAQHLAHPGHR